MEYQQELKVSVAALEDSSPRRHPTELEALTHNRKEHVLKLSSFRN